VLCKAGSSYIPAREILETLHGDALMVQCERKVAGQQIARFEYAFLRESGFYLRLSEDAGRQKVQVRYTEIRYRR
jgi:hypothetical protein